MKYLIASLALFLFSAVELVSASPETTQGIASGAPAPDFKLTDQSGKIHSLSDYRGKYLVLHWTNAKCPFVQRHYKENTFNNLDKEFSGKNVAVLGIDSSNFITVDAIKGTAIEQKITYPILLDSSGQVGRRYGAKSTPHVFVINPEGKIIYQGAVDDDPTGDNEPLKRTNYIRATLNDALAGKQLTVTATKSYGCSVKYAS